MICVNFFFLHSFLGTGAQDRHNHYRMQHGRRGQEEERFTIEKSELAGLGDVQEWFRGTESCILLVWPDE